MTAVTGSPVGTSVRRREDERILTGRGNFIADLSRAGMLEVAFVRSPLAHARIESIDAERARSMPGVVAVFTGAELDPETEPHALGMKLDDFLTASYRTLASDKVRYVGDPVAFVVAESRALAEDACDAVEVEYDALDAVVTAEDAEDSGKPAVFDEMGGNVARRAVKIFGDPDTAFAAADRVVRSTIRLPRISSAPIDMRGGLAEYDAETETLTYNCATRNPHSVRAALSQILSHPLERIDVIAPDIGGAFGQKSFAAREDVCVCFAAMKLGRAVRWIEDRAENLRSAGHGRGEQFDVAAAVRNDGTILALDVRATLDQGAYPVSFPLAVFGMSTAVVLPNAYRIDHIRWEELDIVTNKASFGPVRGPWSGETLLRETIVDAVARELSLDPVDVRRRNLVPLDEQPRKTAAGMTLEGATAVDCLERAVELVGYDALRAEQKSARADGRLLGIGVASYVEPAPGPPDYGAALGFNLPEETAEVRLEADGTLTVFTSQTPHGQSHETTLAQIAAGELGIPIDRVTVVFGDTRSTPASMLGTGGSRASSMASGAVLHATRALRERLKASEDVPPEGLRESASFAAGRGGWSGGTHVCVVAVDPETGDVSIVRYVLVEDCGKLINPAVVDGQVRGGVAMGIGIALLEDMGYDQDGNPSSTLMDYLLPTAMEVPTIEITHLESEPLHEVDYRGVGEGGTIAAPPALVNAIADVVGGIPELVLPLTPNRVLDLLDRAGARS